MINGRADVRHIREIEWNTGRFTVPDLGIASCGR